MYATQVDGKAITLGVSGMLWNRSLVMYDKETNSHWSHILGTAMDGPWEGTQLQHVPSSMTEWSKWRDQFPQTDVLWMSRTAFDFKRGYYNSRSFVVGLVHYGSAHAWTYGLLKASPIQNVAVLDDPMVVAMETESVTVRIYDRRLDDKVLEFGQHEQGMKDGDGNVWDIVTGKCIAGQREGQSLQPMPGIVSFEKSWRAFYPQTQLHGKQ